MFSPQPNNASLFSHAMIAVLAAQRHLFSLGITAWQDAAVGEQLHRAYLRLAGDGRLRAAVRGALWWEPGEGMGQLDRLVTRSCETTGRYSAGTVKLMLDGVCENFTARTLTPYLDVTGNPTAAHALMTVRASISEI